MLYNKYLKIFSDIKPESDLEVRLVTHLIKEVYAFEKTNSTSESIDLYLAPLYGNSIINKPVAEVYENYCSWCKLKHLTPENKKKFSQGVYKHFNVITKRTTLKGIQTRIYRNRDAV